MSTDSPLQNPDTRRAMWAVVVCCAVVAVVYWFGGKEILENRRLAEANAQHQEATEKAVEVGHRLTRENKRELELIAASLDESARDRKGLEKLQARFNTMETSMDEFRKSIGTVRYQAAETEARHARSRAMLDSVYRRGRQVQEDLDTLRDIGNTWAARKQELLAADNLDGRRLAAVPSAVNELYVVLNHQPDFEAAPAELSSQFGPWFDRIKSAHADSNVIQHVDDEDEKFLTDIATKIGKATAAVERNQRVVERLVEKHSGDDPGQMGLAAAFRKRLDERAVAWTRTVDHEIRQIAKEEEQSRIEAIRKEQRAREKLLTEDAVEKERAKTLEVQRELDRKRRQRIEQQEELNQQQLRAEYKRDLPQMRSLLAPFFDTALSQPWNGYRPFKQEWKQVPVSLAALRGSGALADSDAGRRFLYSFAGHMGNSRKKGGFPTYSDHGYAQPHVKQTVARAQQFLIKYGKLLVADELLTP